MMPGRSSNDRLPGLVLGSRISSLTFAMLATLASIYVAGRLWIEAENRVYLGKELDRRIGQERHAISLDDTLKLIACRERKNRLGAVQMDLDSAKQEGFLANHHNNHGVHKKNIVVIGIMTSFTRKKNRDAIRRAWMPSGATLKKLEERGTVIRFVIGRSANDGDSSDSEIQTESRKMNDIIVLDDHVETIDKFPNKVKSFFIYAIERWEADFYAKVNDDVYVNIDALGTTLAAHLDKPRSYIGCMKSGEVFSTTTNKWYEPDWWKFGDKKSYFRHASGEIFVISRALAWFLQINRSMLRTYGHDDISAGSWFIGLDVAHVDERKFCCSSWSSGAICAAV